MKKFIYTAVAALSLVTTSTMAIAAAPAPVAPVMTPLTQPASENVAGDSQFAGISGIGLIIGVGVFAGLIATIVFAIKSTDNRGSTPVVRTSP